MALQLMPEPKLHRWQEADIDANQLAASTAASGCAHNIDPDPHDDDLDRLEQIEEQRDGKGQPSACVSPRDGDGDEWQRLNGGLHAQHRPGVDLCVSPLSLLSQPPIPPVTPNYSMLRSGADNGRGQVAAAQPQLHL